MTSSTTMVNRQDIQVMIRQHIRITGLNITKHMGNTQLLKVFHKHPQLLFQTNKLSIKILKYKLSLLNRLKLLNNLPPSPRLLTQLNLDISSNMTIVSIISSTQAITSNIMDSMPLLILQLQLTISSTMPNKQQ